MFFVEPTPLYQAYHRATEIGRARKLASADYSELFTVSAPDISRSDNEALARSARDITQGMQTLASQLPGQSETFIKHLLRIVFKFAGEPKTEDVIENIYQEAIEQEKLLPSSSSKQSEEL